ncbi:class I SAM-dependent methyltransferase [Thiotrichales bacterium 19S9-12]|nr:class I SAM-dependent methyltransferase [Thiotrichales bacterium 19S9-11]MCF6811395.1 class I SAM-dependent methyltransferase [Thiotrichales bacterium 19S9-12]
MSISTLLESKSLHSYVVKKAQSQWSEVQKEMVADAIQQEHAQMNTSLDQLQFIRFLLKSINARNAIEVGVFRGIGTLTIASSLPSDGKVIACDITDEYINPFKHYWQKAGVIDKIDLRIKPAEETLNELIQQGMKGTFDFIYVDADKISNIRYYELSLQLLRTGGVLAVDNVLASGAVANDSDQKQKAKLARSFNDHVSQDSRVISSLLSIGDGLYLIYKA